MVFRGLHSNVHLRAELTERVVHLEQHRYDAESDEGTEVNHSDLPFFVIAAKA